VGALVPAPPKSSEDSWVEKYKSLTDKTLDFTGLLLRRVTVKKYLVPIISEKEMFVP
tara:strand:- start:4316 stop:4486 length:171 start_codon:yes stop_codon:yes gene_type:complete